MRVVYYFRFKCPCGRGYSRADHFRAHAVKCEKYSGLEDLEGWGELAD